MPSATSYMRGPQERGALHDRRTYTPQDTPVLYVPAGRELCAGQRMCVPGHQSSLYKRLPSGKLSQPVPMWASTAPRLTTNVIQNIDEDQGAARTLCHDTPPFVFHPYEPAFSPRFLTRGAEWPVLLARADTAHATQALTDTDNPNPDTPATIRIGKINTNCAQPTDGKIAFPSPPNNPDSDVMLVASFGGSDSDSDYVESSKNSPTRSTNTPDLRGHIRELEM